MASATSVSRRSETTILSGHTFLFAVLSLLTACVLSTNMMATVTPGEIIPNSTTAMVGTTFDPVNGVSVTFRWRTVHPSTSIVIIENSSDYRGNNNSPIRQVVQNDNTTTHTVVVDHFPAYGPYPTWAYYVVSRQPNGVWASYPGPATAACGSFPGCGGSYLTFTMSTTPNNPNGPLVFTLWPIGGQNVYQGDRTQSPPCSPISKSSRECNDLYIALQPNQLSGPTDRIVQMQNAKVTDLDNGRQVIDQSITAQYLCDFTAPTNPPPSGWDGTYVSEETCYSGTIYSVNTALRLRVNSHAAPGHYRFTANFQALSNNSPSGNPALVSYDFTVLPTASFTRTRPTSFPDIANLSTWQNNMVNPIPYQRQGLPYRSAEWWCTNNSDTNPWWSLDNGNFTGYFDLPSSIYFEAWNYDGARVYQQISDYDFNVEGMPGHRNLDHRDHWRRCAQLALEPYKDTSIATKGGFVQEANQFPYGLEMNFFRTGDQTNVTAADAIAQNPVWNLYYAGNVYAVSARVTAYMLDDRLTAEMLGAQRDNTFLLRTVDVLLGYLDQAYNLNVNNPNQQSFDIHPFHIGLIMESLINYYELDRAEGNTPDARIPLEIKKTLDWYSASQYVSSTHTLYYQAYDLPADPTLVGGCLFGCTSLNDLISPAYAWYWYNSNNPTYQAEGDDLFNHVFDDAGGPGSILGNGWTWSVKEFNQIYKWSFDYVRWRSGHNPTGSSPAVATVLPAANPCDNTTNPCNAPWTDNTTPVQFEWWPGNGTSSPIVYPGTVPGPTFKNGVGTFWFNTFKPNTSLTVYYGTATPGSCNLNDPQAPNCMQPFPNFGFQQMLSANYANHSSTTAGTQDLTALSEGINNIYDETVTITGLAPNTTYHWRPLLTDSAGNMTAFYDQTFTTPGADDTSAPNADVNGERQGSVTWRAAHASR